MFRNKEMMDRRPSWLKLLMLIVPVIILFVGASIFAVNKWYKDNLQPLSDGPSEAKIVVIESGSSSRDIGKTLKEKGVIRSSTAFSWYVGRHESRSELKAGTYEFSPTQSVQEIVEDLAEGNVAVNLYTVLPGKRLDELKEDFVEFGFTEEEVTTAFNKQYTHPLFENVPKTADLEGYIYPETYQITSESTVEDILRTSFDHFYKELSSDFMSQLRGQGLSLHQAVILSSIVQQESSDINDQRQIAQVFLSRLEQGMALGSDVTFFYAAEINGVEPAVDLDSPYNTRIYKGLPPGPISNFNLEAIEAVANPSNTDWLFFVAGDDGNTYFSKTVEEHDKLVEEHCIELCRLP